MFIVTWLLRFVCLRLFGWLVGFCVGVRVVVYLFCFDLFGLTFLFGVCFGIRSSLLYIVLVAAFSVWVGLSLLPVTVMLVFNSRFLTLVFCFYIFTIS